MTFVWDAAVPKHYSHFLLTVLRQRMPHLVSLTLRCLSLYDIPAFLETLSCHTQPTALSFAFLLDVDAEF